MTLGLEVTGCSGYQVYVRRQVSSGFCGHCLANARLFSGTCHVVYHPPMVLGQLRGPMVPEGIAEGLGLMPLGRGILLFPWTQSVAFMWLPLTWGDTRSSQTGSLSVVVRSVCTSYSLMCAEGSLPSECPGGWVGGWVAPCSAPVLAAAWRADCNGAHWGSCHRGSLQCCICPPLVSPAACAVLYNGA